MINKFYLNEKLILEIKEVLDKSGTAQLYGFLDTNYFDSLKINKFRRKFELGASNYEFFEYKDKALMHELKNFISFLCNEKLKFKSAKIFSFKNGDYSILTDKNKEFYGIKLILNLTKWSNSFGGYNCLIKNNEEFFRTEGVANCLSIIKTNNEMKSFVKYVNNFSKNNRRLFLEVNFKL